MYAVGLLYSCYSNNGYKLIQEMHRADQLLRSISKTDQNQLVFLVSTNLPSTKTTTFDQFQSRSNIFRPNRRRTKSWIVKPREKKMKKKIREVSDVNVNVVADVEVIWTNFCSGEQKQFFRSLRDFCPKSNEQSDERTQNLEHCVFDSWWCPH